MGSAVLNPSSRPSPPVPSEEATAPESAEALRQQAAARIAALRQRRQQAATRPATSSAQPTPCAPTPGESVILTLTEGKGKNPPISTRAADRVLPEPHGNPAPSADSKSRIAAAVAERYAQAQTYRAFLAAEAERATQQARAAAEIAARNARAVAEAQQQLLDSLAAEAKAQAAAEAPSETPATQLELEQDWVPLQPEEATPELHEPEEPALPTVTPSLRVAFYEDIPPLPTPAAASRPAVRPDRYDPYDPEAYLLDEEISFRQSPVFEEPAGPPTALPANLIQFPRQLIASRKARPRYAEGPLRDEPLAADNGSQLRIFEVDPAQIATTPETDATAEAQWTSLWLDTPSLGHAPAASHSDRHSAPELRETEAPPFLAGDPAQALPSPTAAPQLYPARWSRRTLAASIDLGITLAATLAFAAAFAAITGHAATAAWDIQSLLAGAAASLHGLPLLTAVGLFTGTGIALSLAYQALFFTFSEATPGMRLARIGLCTFSDDNPTRAALRRRVPALALSTLLFGIGLLWALLDEDGLPWHDLISRTYQRSY